LGQVSKTSEPPVQAIPIEPNGAGITNATGRAKLAATSYRIAATVIYDHTLIATDSIISLHQTRKQMLYPRKHCHRVQGDILETLQHHPKI